MQIRISNLNRLKMSRRNVFLSVLVILAILIATAAGFAATRRKQEVAKITSAIPQGASEHNLPAEPQLEARGIVWPAQGTMSEELRARLTKPELDKIDTSSLPVLLPNVPEVGEGSFLPGSYGYSFSLTSSDQYSMVIYAFNKRYPGNMGANEQEATSSIEAADRIDGKAVSTGGGEGILGAEWEEFGAKYLVKFSCGAQVRDQDCADKFSHFLRTLQFVGGNFGHT